MSNLFCTPRGPGEPLLIAPSILSADFGRMGEECAAMMEAGADLLHVDVMDGHFAPNLTMGPDMCRGIRGMLPDVFLDVHLMVEEPGEYVEPFAKAGADHLTFHVEVAGGDAGRALCERIRDEGMSAGVAINPGTKAESLEGLLEDVDLVLVMSVWPGFSGQSFIEETLETTRWAAQRLREDQRLEMDGGLDLSTSPRAVAAGCEVLVSGSALFGQPCEKWGEIVRGFRAARG